MPKYIATQSVGQFMPGDEIKGLDAERIQALLASGAIEEYKAPEPQQSDDSVLAKLQAENAEQAAQIQALTDENAKLQAALDEAQKQAETPAKPATASKTTTKAAATKAAE